jgi:hypothetical protein
VHAVVVVRCRSDVIIYTSVRIIILFSGRGYHILFVPLFIVVCVCVCVWPVMVFLPKHN